MDIRTKGEMNRGWRVFGAMLAACLLTGCWFLFVYKTVPFIYDINDDVAMRNVAAASLLARRTPIFCIQISAGPGDKRSLSVLPGLDWYGLTMIGVVRCPLPSACTAVWYLKKGFSGKSYMRRRHCS